MFNHLPTFVSRTLAQNASMAEEAGYYGFHPTRRTFMADAARIPNGDRKPSEGLSKTLSCSHVVAVFG